MVVALPYVESIVHTPGSFQEDYQYNLNSLFDPNRTGTGHQPLGFDQWATFYNRYVVTGVYFKVSFINTSSTVPLRVSCAATNSATAITQLNSEEQPYSTSTVLGLSSGEAVDSVAAYIDMPRLNGKTGAQYRASDNNSAQFGASPAEIMILHVYLTSIDGSNITAQTDTRLVFEAELFDPLELASS